MNAWTGGALKRLPGAFDVLGAGARKTRNHRTAHDRGDGALTESMVDEVVSVEPFAKDGKEKLARLDGSGVDGIANSNAFRLEGTARLDQFGGARQRHQHFGRRGNF